MGAPGQRLHCTLEAKGGKSSILSTEATLENFQAMFSVKMHVFKPEANRRLNQEEAEKSSHRRMG